MNKKKIALTVTILVTMLFAFSIEFAHSSTDSYSNTNTYAQSLASTFLGQVSGFDMSNYRIISFNVSTPKILNSQTSQIIISAIISDGNGNFSLAMSIINGKVWFFNLNLLSGNLRSTQTSTNDRLAIASNAIDEYKQQFNANYCSGFAQMVPTSLEIQNATISRDDAMLNVSSNTSTEKVESTTFTWYKIIDASTIPQMSITIIVSKTGLITSFYDNLCFYNMANVKTTVTKESAIAIAQPYIEEYAQDNGQTVKTIEAKLEYTVDSSASRGDNNLIYPQWKVFAQLDGLNQYNITEYGVMIWADNGVVYHYGPQGHYRSISRDAITPVLYPVPIVVVVSIATAGAMLLVRRRSKNQQRRTEAKFHLKLGSALILVSILSLSIVPSCFATSNSVVLGSRYNIPTEERTVDTTITNAIANYSTSAGYSTSNLYGSSTTANGIYYGAIGGSGGGVFDIVFYIGHGGHSVEWHYWGWPWQWHTHDYLAMTADDGSLVRDNDIWHNSFYQSINGQKAVVLWSCHLGEDAMGSWITYPCGDTQEHGMPYAWNHVTSLSFDGYFSPDSSGQVFIGFIGPAPFLSYDGFGMNDAGLVFLHHFYYAALIYGWTVHDSLDLAAQSVWGVNYGSTSCIFRNGYTLDGENGHIVVYGQGTIYM